MAEKAAQDDAASHSPTPKHLISSPSSTPRKAGRQTSSPQLIALGELEFRKAFLILSYIGDKRLEDVLSAEEIRRLKNLPMGLFETQVWNALGRKFIKEEDRRKSSLDWDSDKAHLYHCHVSPDGSYRFKGPYLNKTRTHLQRVLGDENVLIVKFAEDVTDRRSLNCSTDSYASYNKIAKEGIFVGLRQYRFFVFKDGGKEEKKKNPSSSVKCYFVFMESNVLSGKTMHEARCIFMHAHMVSSVAKYMARFSLILSKTIKLDVDLSTVNVETIDDEQGRDEDGYVVYDEDWKPLIHTDGTGFISEDLALRCPNNLYRGEYMNNGNSDRFVGNVELVEKYSELRCSETRTWEPPLLIQCRLFNNGCAVKGTLLLNRKLPPRTIQIRPSMIKVEMDKKLSDTQTVNSLEINGTSRQPRRAYLSKFLIALLSYGGVPKEYFMNILMDALEDAPSVQSSKRAALRVSLRFGEMDDSIVTRMILSGIPIDEPFLQYRLSFMMKEERKGLMVGKVPVKDSFYLMGTADPTGTLRSDEVCIILDHGQIQGRVLVYKHPGLHFGDIHVLNATYVEALKDFVGNAKYAIFFPINGPRSLTDEIANSDLDGDMYWVSRNPQLLECFRASEPWMHKGSTRNVPSKSPSEFSPDELEHELFQMFLTTRFQTSSAISVAADNWLVFMDRLLTLRDDCSEEKDCLKRKMLELTDIYYDALDAPKSGMKVNVPNELKAEKFPHFMGRECSYHSTSILGQIYDTVDSFKMESKLTKEIWRLPLYNIDAVPQVCLESWKDRYDQYRSEMAAALQHGGEIKEEYAAQVIKKYKQILYNAEEFEESPRKLEDIFDEALAIYHVTYEFAINRAQVSYCNFPWRVAGRALCKLYTIKLGEKSMVCLPSVLRDAFN